MESMWIMSCTLIIHHNYITSVNMNLVSLNAFQTPQNIICLYDRFPVTIKPRFPPCWRFLWSHILIFFSPSPPPSIFTSPVLHSEGTGLCCPNFLRLLISSLKSRSHINQSSGGKLNQSVAIFPSHCLFLHRDNHFKKMWLPVYKTLILWLSVTSDGLENEVFLGSRPSERCLEKILPKILCYIVGYLDIVWKSIAVTCMIKSWTANS